MRFIGVEVEQETSAPLLKKILDPPLSPAHNHTIVSNMYTFSILGVLGIEVPAVISHQCNIIVVNTTIVMLQTKT